MSGGRPHKHRSRLLTGVGGAPVRDQRRAVWEALRGAYDDEPPVGLLEALEDARASYQAAAAAWARDVGAGDVAADLAAIAAECRQLAADLAGWPLAVRAALCPA